MKIDQEKSDFLEEMLSRWQEENLLTEETAGKLRKSYEVKTFDWPSIPSGSRWLAGLYLWAHYWWMMWC